jgi:hypothetical protein
MEQAIRFQNYQDSGTFLDPDAFTARVQDETLSSRKNLAYEPIQTSTSSATASFTCAVGVALCSEADVTAGIDEFMSQKLAEGLAEVTVRLKDAAKKPDILQQPSSYFPAGATTSDLISFIRNHVRLAYSGSLANRLDYLREASIEEAPEQAPISVNSLQSFVSFIAREPRLAEPEVVLTYTGNTRAEWHESRKEHFSVEFLSNGQVRYVVFARDPNHATRTDRAFGLVSAETLMAKVSPFNVLAWAAS